MNVQIVIPIFKPQKLLCEKIIPHLLQQTVESSLLLIDSSYEDIPILTAKIIKISKSEFNHSNTRNLALNYTAEFYMFMTQDAMPYDKNLVEKLVQAFEDPNIVVAYARQIPYHNADSIEFFARSTNYPNISKIKSKDDLTKMGIKTFFSSDSCAMYRSSYFKEVGGFKKDLNTNEDMEFAARAIMNGKKIAYVADAKVYHSHKFTYIGIWKRYRAIGKFFAQNEWILEEVALYSNAESTGIKQALAELKYLFHHSPLDIPRSIIFSFIKYIAFKSAF